jgi:hypothetical protein
MILLLIMLVGLLILRRHHDGTVGLTHLLWKQVWWRRGDSYWPWMLMSFL